MNGVSKTILIGRLGGDPEIRYSGDMAIANFSLATGGKYKNKAGEEIDGTQWHNIVAFKKLAEVCGEYLKKGKQIFVEGEIKYKTWEKDGETKYRTEIHIFQMQMLGSKED